MSEERRRILDMLAQGKVSVEEAESLLSAIGEAADEAPALSAGEKRKPRYLRVIVNEDGAPDGQEKVRIKVPLILLRAGIKMGSLLSERARGKITAELRAKGIDTDPFDLPPENLEELVAALDELEIEADDKGEKVRIFVE